MDRFDGKLGTTWADSFGNAVEFVELSPEVAVVSKLWRGPQPLGDEQLLAWREQLTESEVDP